MPRSRGLLSPPPLLWDTPLFSTRVAISPVRWYLIFSDNNRVRGPPPRQRATPGTTPRPTGPTPAHHRPPGFVNALTPPALTYIHSPPRSTLRLPPGARFLPLRGQAPGAGPPRRTGGLPGWSGPRLGREARPLPGCAHQPAARPGRPASSARTSTGRVAPSTMTARSMEAREDRDAPAPAPAATAAGPNLVSVALAVVGATAGLLFGYDTGVVSGAMLLIRSAGWLASRHLAPSRRCTARSWPRRLVLCRRPEMALENKWHEYIVSGTVLAAWVFSFVGGWAVGEFARESRRSRMGPLVRK